MSEIWILGATGRSGRAVAKHLAATQFSPVLVGRDAVRLRALAAATGRELRIVTASSVDAMIAEISRNKPTVVISTIGPFTKTAVSIARACPPGTHYVDISNELPSLIALLALHDEAASSGRTFVTAAGFGVLATESLVLKLCEGRPPALRVRVDAVPSVESEPGRLGDALAATIIEAAAFGGRRYANGRLERVRAFSDVETLRLPDGSTVKTACGPTGDLEAARGASGASFALAASSLAPTSALLRALLPPAMSLLRIAAIGDLAKRRLAAVEFKPKKPGEPKGREFSWTHAKVEWATGETREGWLRVGDAMTFTTAIMVEVASRLARGEGRMGAYTPGALFGPELALQMGGQFFLDQKAP